MVTEQAGQSPIVKLPPDDNFTAHCRRQASLKPRGKPCRHLSRDREWKVGSMRVEP